MSRIILTAENFAFGPIGKLLDIAEELKKRGHNLTFAGYGTSYQLAKNFPFDTLIEIDTDNPKNNDSLIEIIKNGQVLVTSMDLASVIAAKKAKVPVVWIDCLFWFWTSISDVLFDIDIYIREKSLKDDVNDKKYATKIKNLYTVGTIIPKVKSIKREKQAIISFGGGEASYWYKEGVDTNFPTMMTEILSKYVNWSDFEKIIVTTNERIVDELAAKFPESKFTFTTCGSHTGFLKELAKSEIALITPGLVTSQSVFDFGTPTLFIPPSNNSQYIQIEEFKETGLAVASVRLDEFLPKLQLRGRNPHDTVKDVLEQLKLVDGSVDLKRKIGSAINELILTRNVWKDEAVSRGHEFIESLGGNGLDRVISKIEETIKNHK